MSVYLSNLVNKVNESIAENFLFGEPDYYAIYDASFIWDLFNHVKFDNKNLQLGIYRVGKYGSGFYCAPYVHLNKLTGDYSPTLEEVPFKKNFLQKLGFIKTPKPEYRVSNNYDVSLSIDGIIQETMIGSIPSPLQHTLIEDWNRDGIWDIFLLDNLQYILPTFGHGAYVTRKLITCPEDFHDLPIEIRVKAQHLSHNLLPKVEYSKNMATITICYFNKWEGLVQWCLNYYTLDDSISPLYSNRIILPGDKYHIILPYDCGIRF